MPDDAKRDDDAATLARMLRALPPGTYTLDVAPYVSPPLKHEGGCYFRDFASGKVFSISGKH